MKLFMNKMEMEIIQFSAISVKFNYLKCILHDYYKI